MTQQQSYDLLVIGAGAAGSTAATAAAERGARVALVERDKLGGTCLNYGCDPTKTVLHIAMLLHRTGHLDRFGLQVASPSFEWSRVVQHVQQVINSIRGGTTDEASEKMRENGVEVLKGEARFIAPHEIAVKSTREGQGEETEQRIFAERIIIASGCETVIPPIEGLRETGFITNVEAVSLPALPRRLAVIGGGPLGIEFAQMFQRFGVAVTVLEATPQILNKEDRELADLLCSQLEQEGITLKPQAELLRVQRTGEGKLLPLRLERDGKAIEEELLVDEILLSLGRRAAISSLNLEAAGVETSEKGITVDDTLRTNVPHIWAAGDVTGALQFTHLANEQGKVVARNAFTQHPQPFGDHVIPWVTFTDPPLAHVGKTEEELREEKIAYWVGRMQFSDMERAVAEGDTTGLVKLLVDAQGKVLGGHILGARADDLLAPIVLAMQTGLPASALAATILPYPSRSEGVRWAADRIGGQED